MAVLGGSRGNGDTEWIFLPFLTQLLHRPAWTTCWCPVLDQVVCLGPIIGDILAEEGPVQTFLKGGCSQERDEDADGKRILAPLVAVAPTTSIR